jgi:hypothetical protein
MDTSKVEKESPYSGEFLDFWEILFDPGGMLVLEVTVELYNRLSAPSKIGELSIERTGNIVHLNAVPKTRSGVQTRFYVKNCPDKSSWIQHTCDDQQEHSR